MTPKLRATQPTAFRIAIHTAELPLSLVNEIAELTGGWLDINTGELVLAEIEKVKQ